MIYKLRIYEAIQKTIKALYIYSKEFIREKKFNRQIKMDTIYVVLAVVAAVVIILYFMRSGDSIESQTEDNIKGDTKTQKGEMKQIYTALVSEGYKRNDTSYCKKFSKNDAQSRIELEFSTLKKRQTKMDIDVYSKGFNIVLPDNVTPGFFDHVVFRNYNKMLQATENKELLPDVQEGGYFLRSSFVFSASEIPEYQSLQENIDSHFRIFKEFSFIEEGDLNHDLFQSLVADGYQYSYVPQQMMLRLCKRTEEENYSLYYVKALKMLFLASSPLSNSEIQEDFRDERTKLHHFNDTEESESEVKELVFPSYEDFRDIEAEFIEEWQHYDEEE